MPDTHVAAADRLAASPATAAGRHGTRRVVVATTLGNAFEIFDFTVFSFFATLIGRLYFPSDSEYGSLLMAVASFGIGFVMRPLGGVVIGAYADRAGRKAALTLTIALMALGTAVIGFAPTYAQIGIFAPLLIVTGRLLQGFSAGGEIGASTTFLMESGTIGRRGRMVSWQLASQGAAALAGAACGVLLSQALPADSFESWGWRLPFILGLAIAPVGIWIRRSLDETHSAPMPDHSPIALVFRDHRRTLLLGTLAMVSGTATMYIAVFYMPTFLIRVMGMAPGAAFAATVVSGLTLMVVSPLAGLAADRLPRRKPLVLAAWIAGGIAIWPGFTAITGGAGIVTAMVVVAILAACLAAGSSACFLLLMEAFPRPVRVTGLSVIYSLGVAIFGGLAQFIVTWLLAVTGDAMAPAWYMTACAVISVLALLGFREQARRAD
ncbi:MFS transporter [Tistrella mobilis]